jgi:hypothetical protein
MGSRESFDTQSLLEDSGLGPIEGLGDILDDLLFLLQVGGLHQLQLLLVLQH